MFCYHNARAKCVECFKLFCVCVRLCVCVSVPYVPTFSDSHHTHSYHFPEGTKFLIYFHLRCVVSPFEIAMTYITFFTRGVLHDIPVDCCTFVNEVVQ